MISIGQSLMIFGLDIAGFEWKTSHESTDDISTTLLTLSTNCITIKRMLNLKKKKPSSSKFYFYLALTSLSL